MRISYVLPIRASACRRELIDYVHELASLVEVIVVDGSDAQVFADHHEAFGAGIRHLPVDPDRITLVGKVGGVLTGVAAASNEHVVIADDDVRYRADQLERMGALLARHDVVRPQNWFHPLPWHARWDTGRILLNRVFGGDWPGTLGVRRSALLAVGGYAGDVMFENLELVRTIEAGGGRACVDLGLLVRRAPPTTRQFLDQRVRQAYDEFARPWRLAAFLALAPVVVATRGRCLRFLVPATITIGEVGRRRAGGRDVFPATAALWAPLWLAERACTSWVAAYMRLRHGGVRYRGQIVPRAATPRRVLRRRLRRSGSPFGPAS